jgi:hypothetical protein
MKQLLAMHGSQRAVGEGSRAHIALAG